MSVIDLANPQITWIIIGLLPGFLTLRIYYLFTTEIPKPTIDKAAEYLSTTILVIAVNWGILYLVRSQLSKALLIPSLLVSVVVVPVVLALCILGCRRLLVLRGAIHPTPKGWDAFFSRQAPCFIRFHLCNGTIVGGYYGVNSFASNFPHKEDIYVETVLHVDQDTGEFIGFVENSCGMLIERSECRYLELSKS